MHCLAVGVCVSLVILSFLAHPAIAIDWKTLAQTGSGQVVTLLEVGGGDDYDEGDPVFVRPGAICVAADESFYVIDYTGVIVHFNSEGTELHRFGREGEGPGEFKWPSSIAVDAQGRLWICEIGNHRISILQPDGTFVATKPFQEIVEDIVVMPDQGILMLATGETGWPEPLATTRLTRYDSDLASPAVIDSLTATRTYVFSHGGGNSTSVSTPYCPSLNFCPLPGGLFAYTRDDRYEIHVVGPDLRPRYTLRRDVQAPLVTKKDREDYFARFESSDPTFTACLRSDITFPKHKLVIERIFSDGSFLIVVRDGPTLDVFEGENFLGEISVPEFRRPRAVRDGRLFRPHYSREQLPSVVVYTVQ